MTDDQATETQLDLGMTDQAWKNQLETMRASYDSMVRAGDVRRLQLWDRIVDHVLLKPQSFGDRFRTRIRAAYVTVESALAQLTESDYAGCLKTVKGLQLTLQSIGRNIPGCLPKGVE